MVPHMRALATLLAVVSLPVSAQWDFTPKPCTPDQKLNARFDGLALALAKKSVPDAKLKQSCVVVMGAAFVRFEDVVAEREGITFTVPLLVSYLGDASKKAPSTKPSEWRSTLPFPLAELGRYAGLIKQDSLTASALGKSFECRVERDLEDPHVVGFLCGPGSLRPNATTPSSGAFPVGVPVLEFLAHDPKPGCDCPPFFLDGYSLPLSSVSAHAPGLCLLQKDGEAQRFAKARPNGFVQLSHDEGQVSVSITEGKVLLVREPLKGPFKTKCQLVPPCP